MKIMIQGLTLMLVLATGCSTDKVHSVMRTKAAPVSDFLPRHDLLVEQPATFPFHYFYLNENVSSYENVYIAPLNVDYLRKSDGWAKFDEVLAGQLGTKVEDLREFTRSAYQQAFQKMTGGNRLKVVNRTDLPKTLIVEPALIAVKLTKAELAVVGTAASVALPVLGTAAFAMSAGSINVECRVRDARTKEIIAMYADTERDPDSVIPVANLTWSRSTRINIKMIAAQTAKVLSAKDYRSIRRDFPVRFINKIKDADL